MKTNKDKIRERICMRCGVAEKDVRKWKGGCSVWGTSYKTHRYINYSKPMKTNSDLEAQQSLKDKILDEIEYERWECRHTKEQSLENIKKIINL